MNRQGIQESLSLTGEAHTPGPLPPPWTGEMVEVFLHKGVGALGATSYPLTSYSK